MGRHTVINPDGDEIILPCFAINALSALSCLRRGHGYPVITSGIYAAISFISVMTAGPQPLRAYNYGRPRSDGGARSAADKFTNAIGPNFEGCRLVMCDCGED